MIKYAYEDLFFTDCDKQLHIYYDQDGHINNSDLYSGNFTLQESLCSSKDLKFGACESSCVTFKIANSFVPLKGKTIRIEQVLDGRTDKPFVYGTYKVESDSPTADRFGRVIKAYDSLYELLNANLTNWFNENFPTTFAIVTLRNALFEHFGIIQENVELPNDNVVIRNNTSGSVSGRDLITSICELNGCFGHIGRDNQFHYIFFSEITEGLYPAKDLYPEPTLYPRTESVDKVIEKSNYITVQYEDYEVQKIDKVNIYNAKNALLASKGSGTNTYNIKNVLANGLTNDNAKIVLNKIFDLMQRAWYMPATVDMIGDPCLEAGDSIRLITTDKVVYTFLFKRTIKGIQAIRDKIEATGSEYRTDNINSVETKVQANNERTEAVRGDLSATNTNLSNVTKTVNTIAADYITTSQLSASNARIGNLEADHVSVSSFNALSATVNTIKANYITANSLSATLINSKLSSASEIIVGGRNYKPITFSYAGTNYYILAADRNY